jgi:hypothetical protein
VPLAGRCAVRLASSVTLDMNEGVWIDGIKFPFYVADHAAVTAGRDLITTVSLDLFVDGVVTVRDRDGKRRVYDGREGDVAEWARRLVREGLLERMPDLELPTEEVDA